MNSNRQIRVGNAGGYWGDDPHALCRQVSGGALDYVTQDFLAEITMSILQKQRARQPDMGYAADLLQQLRPCLSAVIESGVKLISNAGGINPVGCAEALERLCYEEDAHLRIGVVEGDDLMHRLDELAEDGGLRNMETGQSFSEIRDRVQSANAYVGMGPVVKALQLGAQLIVTGRVTDTAIVAAPANFEYEWDPDDWDRQASAVVAGHILECGAQASGGNLTDWRRVPSFSATGYPIAEFNLDGSFTITRHPGAGGMVDLTTVTSQLVYEMGDPSRYITPDVIADFTTIRLRDDGSERVGVSGVRGSPRPDSLKVSVSYTDGYKAHGTVIICGPDAVGKAQATAESMWERLGLDFEDHRADLIGFNSAHQHLAPAVDPPEVLLRLGVRDPDREKVTEFSRVFASLILSTVSGIAIVGARPRVQEVIAYWPALVPAAEVTTQVMLLEDRRVFQVPWSEPSATNYRPVEAPAAPPTLVSADVTRVRLSDLCYGRSGDKGDTCNIGIVARSPAAWQWLYHEMTADLVKEYFGPICRGPVERFEVANLMALNFLLHESLGGGGTVSLSVDPQGKTFADALLQMWVEVPPATLENATTDRPVANSGEEK